MVKRSILILINTVAIFLTLFLLISYSKTENAKKDNNKAIFSFWIYPIGTIEETYQFILFDDNTLQVSVGKRKENNNLEPLSLSRIDNQKKKILSDENVNNLMKLVKEIYSNKDIQTDSTDCDDVWVIKLSYKDKEIVQPCYEYTSQVLEVFYNYLIELSPINVDMRGFA